MSVIQALAIAAAVWVTAVSADPSMMAIFDRTHVAADRLAARLEVVASAHLERIEGGFRATPDGVRIHRAAALR